MFDQEKFTMNVSMNGREYMEYKKGKKLSKETKQALPYFMLCAGGILIIIALISNITYVEPPQGIISDWYDAVPSLVNLSWNGIAKVTFLAFGPFIVVLVGLAWLIHGFGFIIIKG